MPPRPPQSLLKALCNDAAARNTATSLPFLYQTRTIFTSTKARNDSYRHFTPRPSGTRAWPGREEVEDLELVERPPRRESTITPTERATFARIFDSIIASSTGQPLHMPSPATTVDADSDDISLDSIFAAALNADPTRRSSSDGLSFGPADPSPEQHDAAIARYPAPLRAAAARASSLSRLRPSASSPADPIERQRREELARIEGLLRGATTDIALWGVLESVIFPLVDKLAPSPPPPTKPSKRRGRVSKSPAPSFPAPQPSLSNLALVGSIYPSVLLLAFRLLAHTHNSPAACSALFGAIKARGPVSYVLGASTALHTEMILLAWRRFHDTDAVSALLAEMHDGGVDFDAATASALQEIIAQAQAGRAAPGAAGRAWQVRVQRGSLAQLVAWRDTVAAKLAAASADLSGAEEAVLAC